MFQPALRSPSLALALAGIASLTAGCAPPLEIDGPEPDPRLGEARQLQTVGEAVDASCSTSSVRGLSLQIIAQGNCIAPGAFTEVPQLGNFVFGENVFPFLEEPARDALVAAAGETSMTITFNSMLRTVAQQYLLRRWDLQGRCGIAIAATPGNSNHESGLAFDTSNYSAWRSLLEGHGYRWYGSGDPVHFDYVGPGAIDHRGVDVQAFQELWNRNHPDDAIDTDGVWGPQTEARMQQAPADGFPLGADCGEMPPPAQGPDLTTTISAVDATDLFTDGASASVVDIFEGETNTFTVRVTNQGAGIGTGAVLAFSVDDPWLAAASYRIETDRGQPGEFTLDSTDATGANPAHDAVLPQRFDLHLGDLAPTETKRITLTVDAVGTSVQQTTVPGLRAWVKNLDDRYEQESFGGEVSGDGSQTFNGGRLEVALPIDVYARTRWEFETDRREGYSAIEGQAQVASGALTAEGAVRSPPLSIGERRVEQVRLRAQRQPGDDAVRLLLLTGPDDSLEDGAGFDLDLPDDGDFHELTVDTTSVGFVPGSLAVAAVEGNAQLRIDWIRIDLGSAPGDDEGDDEGDGTPEPPPFPFDFDEDGTEDGSSPGGCSCRAAGGAPDGPGWLLGLLVAATIARRSRRAA